MEHFSVAKCDTGLPKIRRFWSMSLIRMEKKKQSERKRKEQIENENIFCRID